MMRLNKFLAHAGIASRRKCDDFIKAGFVKVNGKVVDRVGVVIDEKKDTVTFKGKIVKPRKRFVYIVLNKPKGVVTTASDQFKRKTVLDLIAVPERIYPIGRLDYNTTGVLLLTDDGDLSHRLLHPNYKVVKVYRVLLNRVIRPIDLHRLQNGIELDGKKTQPCKISELRIVDNGSLLEVELTEGRNRQVRRMFETLDYKVRELERISFGGITARGLAPGEWRYLTKKEVSLLKERVGYGSER
ncbi:pseudouridine synthase [Calditrichota bacterium LG25]